MQNTIGGRVWQSCLPFIVLDSKFSKFSRFLIKGLRHGDFADFWDKLSWKLVATN